MASALSSSVHCRGSGGNDRVRSWQQRDEGSAGIHGCSLNLEEDQVRQQEHFRRQEGEHLLQRQREEVEHMRQAQQEAEERMRKAQREAEECMRQAQREAEERMRQRHQEEQTGHESVARLEKQARLLHEEQSLQAEGQAQLQQQLQQQKNVPEGFRIVQTKNAQGCVVDMMTHDIHQTQHINLCIVSRDNLLRWLGQKLRRFDVPEDIIRQVHRALVNCKAARLVQNITKPVRGGERTVDRYCIVALQDGSNWRMNIDQFTDHLAWQQPASRDWSLKVETCAVEADVQKELQAEANAQNELQVANGSGGSSAAVRPEDRLIHPQRSILKPLPEGYRIVQTMTKDGRYEDTVTYDIHQSHQMKLSVVKEVNLMSWLEQKLHRFNVPDDAIQSVGKAIVGSTAARVVQSITKPIGIGDAVVDRYCIVALRDKSNPRDRSNFQMRIDHFTDHLGVQCPAPQEWSLKVETCDEMGALPSRTR